MTTTMAMTWLGGFSKRANIVTFDRLKNEGWKHCCWLQGCQIFLGTRYQNRKKCTK
jgi:hypothetical protein